MSFEPKRAELKKKNLESLGRAWRDGEETVEAWPAVLYIETAAVCNLRCPMCPATMGIPREPYRTRLLDMDLMPAVRRALPYATRCFLSGGGEPLLHPRLFEIIQELTDNGVEAYFNSNATLMDEDTARQIVDSGVNTISFSVDGATAETYESIRVGADFDTVVANITRLSKMKREAGALRPFMNMQFTVLDENRAEITAAADLAASMGLNHLVVEPLTPVFCFDEQYDEFYRSRGVETTQVIEDVKRAAERAAELGLVFSSHYLELDRGHDPPRTCAEPWLTFGVRVDGRVFTCCGTLEPMGDLAKQGLREIWNGESYRSLRRALAGGVFPRFCGLCASENRANHFNEDLVPRAEG